MNDATVNTTEDIKTKSIKIYPPSKCKVCATKGYVGMFRSDTISSPNRKSEFEKRITPCGCLMKRAANAAIRGEFNLSKSKVGMDPVTEQCFLFESSAPDMIASGGMALSPDSGIIDTLDNASTLVPSENIVTVQSISTKE